MQLAVYEGFIEAGPQSNRNESGQNGGTCLIPERDGFPLPGGNAHLCGNVGTELDSHLSQEIERDTPTLKWKSKTAPTSIKAQRVREASISARKNASP
jgi:hypothetical protein